MKTASPPQPPEKMGRKAVLYRDTTTALTLDSGQFHEKHLCDGIVLNLGDACVYGCEFCYVEAGMHTDFNSSPYPLLWWRKTLWQRARNL